MSDTSVASLRARLMEVHFRLVTERRGWSDPDDHWADRHDHAIAECQSMIAFLDRAPIFLAEHEG